MDQPRIDLISRALADRRTRRATVLGSGLGLAAAASGAVALWLKTPRR